MDGHDLVERSRFLAKVSLLSAVLLVGLVLLLPLSLDHTRASDAFIVLWGLFLLLSAVILGVALSYLAMTRGLNLEPRAQAPPGEASTSDLATARQTAPPSLLGGLQDEDVSVYRRVVEAGGSLLQGDLVIAQLLPAHKVSRILDRLEARGLVVRQRHGMSNRVLLSDGWRRRGG